MYQLLLYEPSKNPIVKIETERTIINEATKMQLLTFQSQNRTVRLQLFCLDCKIYEPGSIILQLQNVGHANPVCTNCCCMNLVRIPLLKVKLNEQ